MKRTFCALAFTLLIGGTAFGQSLNVSDITMQKSATSKTATVGCTLDRECRDFLFDITITKDGESTSDLELSNVKSLTGTDHTVMFTTYGNGYRNLGYSITQEALSKDVTSLLSFDISPTESSTLTVGDTYTVTLSDITFTYMDGEEVKSITSDDVSFDITVDVTLGDVDGDGDITAQDASLILQVVAEKITSDEIVSAAADIDGDGELTAQDASLILQHVAGKIDLSEFK